MSSATPFETIRWFDECGRDDATLVGGKCASLGELLKAGIRVPSGFAVTTDAYHDFLVRTGIKDPICEVVRGTREGVVLERVGERARAMIREAGVPEETGRAVRAAYRELCDRCGTRDLPVAVRSSATLEDLADASFAGQQDTYLWVRGEEAVVKRVSFCWASLFSDRVIAYREEKGFTHENVRIAVGVQTMVKARSSGVLFTLNPVNGDRSKVAINSAWGFGEGVVSGAITPDEFLVDKVTRDILQRKVVCKPSAFQVDPLGRGLHVARVSAESQALPSLRDEEIQELARVARLIERHYGRPMDVEWALDDALAFPANLMILQARPETVWALKKSSCALEGARSKSALEAIVGSLVAGVAVSPKNP
ncbi:MAG: phenylphosphate synthase subunit beta [Deltaproteobacteria bacterium]|nr:phenylphosphate synthase subunit beta [Deltaproteobacteria bacterium]